MVRKRSRRAGAVAGAALIVTALVGIGPVGADDHEGTITGHVLDAANQPLEGAIVVAYAPTDLWLGTATATTGSDGTYTLSVPAGAYRVLFRAPGVTGWVSEWYDHSATRAGAQDVTVTAGGTVGSVDSKLAPGGWITGTVTDGTGAGVGGAQVWVYADGDGWVGTTATTTDADGTYDLGGIPRGAYRVLFLAPEGSGLEHQWYGGLPIADRWVATQVDVTWNATIPGVDAQLAGGASPPPPDHDVTVGPLVSGTSAAIDGTFAWTDYVYDDRGPNTGAGDMTDWASAGGDAVYPAGLTNAADFVQVQIADGEAGVGIRVVLETLVDPSAPLVGIAFDTDDDSSTGAPTLPGSWSPDGPLGVELLAVMAADAGEVLVWDGATWAHAADLDVSVDPDDNTLDAVVSHTLASPGDATWRVLGVAGVTAAPWTTGAGVVHDLAFVADEPEYQWQDYRQADILGAKAPVADAFATVDFGALADGVDVVADVSTEGFHTFLYRSELNLPEGIQIVGGEPQFLGPYQPYLVYVPAGGHHPGDAMTVFLHGLTQNHLGSVMVGNVYVGTGRPLSTEIGFLGEFVRDGTDFPPHNLTVWPLARGGGLFYEGIAEQDVLDVLADASLRLHPDPDRIILSGASMGGIGTFRLGALYPDLWSVAVPLIGYARTAVHPLLGNLENLEILQINGALDTLIPKNLAEATTDRLDDLGLRYRAWMLDQRGHEAGTFVADCVFGTLPGYARVVDPARVRYTVDPAQFVVDPSIGLTLRHDRAYWVSGIAVADVNARGSVDARSAALPQREIDVVRTDDQFESDDEGRDLCGPNPGISTGDTWRERSVTWGFGAFLPTEHSLDVTLTNLAAVTFALDRAGLADGGPATVVVTTDAVTAVTLTGLEPGQEVSFEGVTVTVAADGTATVTVAAGETPILIAAS